MNVFSKLYVRAVRFYREDLWNPDAAQGHKMPMRVLLAVVRRIVLTVKAFFEERMHYRASALTYITLLSIVPLLSILFAIAKGFGLQQLMEGEIRKAFQAQPELIDTLLGFVNSYLSHAKGGVFLGFGLLLLLWSLLSLTSSIEGTFNQIWQVKRERSFFRKMTDYTAVFFMLPVVMVVASGISIFVTSFVDELPDMLLLRPTLLTALRLVPYVIMCLLFTGIFIFMPNTRVKLKSALVAGIPCGIAFQALQLFYIHSQIWLSSYNAIYGSFAALPLFMLWCQLSWYICLLGTTLSYVDQNIDNFYYGGEDTGVDRRLHDFLCLSVMAAVCDKFSHRREPYSVERLAREKHLPIRQVTNIVYELCKRGLLLEIVGDEKGKAPLFVPACDVGLLTVGSLLGELDGGETKKAFRDAEKFGRVWKRYCTLRERMFETGFAEVKLAEFAKWSGEIRKI